MSFFDGAVSYRDIKTMPLSELISLQEEANEISKHRKAEMERSRRGK